MLDFLDDPVFKIDGFTFTISIIIIIVLLGYIGLMLSKK